MYGVWHPYKYSVEMTYKAFVPIVNFLEQGWELKHGAVVPLKVKPCHMEKTIIGLLLASAANKARLDSTTQVLMDNYRELSDVQRFCFHEHNKNSGTCSITCRAHPTGDLVSAGRRVQTRV